MRKGDKIKRSVSWSWSVYDVIVVGHLGLGGKKGQNCNTLKEKLDAAQEVGVANHVLDNQMVLSLGTLDGHVGVLENQRVFLLDCQEQDSNASTNVSYSLKTNIQEVEECSNTQLVLLRQSQQSLCRNFNETCREMVEAVKVACWERKERLVMKQELDKLKEDFAKLKGMVCLAVAAQNLQSNGFPMEDIIDMFNPWIVEESSSSSDEEVPQENLVPIPMPGSFLEIPQTL